MILVYLIKQVNSSFHTLLGQAYQFYNSLIQAHNFPPLQRLIFSLHNGSGRFNPRVN